MTVRIVGMLMMLACLAVMVQVVSGAGSSLPAEPDESTRVEELFDNDAHLYLLLYSLSGDGRVDYVTGRRVHEQARSEFGNPIYYAARHPQFYWWNHALWSDPEQDGVNGNEVVYQENVEFDRSRYKPCQFNGQAC